MNVAVVVPTAMYPARPPAAAAVTPIQRANMAKPSRECLKMTGAGNRVAGLLLADAPWAGAAPSSPRRPHRVSPGADAAKSGRLVPIPMGHWPLPAAVRAGHCRMRRRGTCSTSMG
jgi:hypothetical protein